MNQRARCIAIAIDAVTKAAAHANPGVIIDTGTRLDSLTLDSLDYVEIELAMDDALGLTLSDGFISDLQSVADVTVGDLAERIKGMAS